ncbi:MAG TPA: substrate-binding domain-containing protein [Alphaproteobacteria bacterium]|nr:substrate-binding domain-containing protein [Alphaproteobacteria bacterium]
MTVVWRALRVITFALAVMTAAAGADPPTVDPRLPAYVPPSTLSGNLTCAGGGTMQSLMQAWARRFEQLNPKAHIDVRSDSKLSAEGFRAFLEGRIDCVTFVREPFPSELKAFREKFGHAPLLVPVAGGSYATRGGTHAIAIYVNAANPLTRLDLTQLDAIFSKTRRRGGAEIDRWRQLGLTGAWADRPIHLYGMLRRRSTGDPPGIVNYVEQRVLLGGKFRDDLKEQVDRPGETALEAIVHRIAEDPDGIGYSGFGYAAPGVKSLALAEFANGPYFTGNPTEVAHQDYPLSRSIYLMFDGSARSPIVDELIRFVGSREGQQIVANDPEGFLPLPATDVRTKNR